MSGPPDTDSTIASRSATCPADLDLPADLGGRSAGDVGCNSGMFCFECTRRGQGFGDDFVLRDPGPSLRCHLVAIDRVAALSGGTDG